MTTAFQIAESKAVVGPRRADKLRVVLSDGSDDYMKIVLALLELHERVDLIGRAANFTEATELVVNHRPDLLLLDLDMHLANLIVPAVVLSSRTPVKIVGLCIDETISFCLLDCITGVNVLVHRSRFRQEFLSVIDVLYGKCNTNQKAQNARVFRNTQSVWNGQR
jgi:AmiR/NasT family two-component response regulator